MARVRGNRDRILWIVAVIAGVLGMLLHYHVIHIAALARYDYLLLVGGFVLLAIAGLMRGL